MAPSPHTAAFTLSLHDALPICKRNHDIVFERASPDPKYRLENNGEHRGFQTEEQRHDDRHVAPACVDVAQSHDGDDARNRSEEHTSELQSLRHLVCRLLLEKKK